MRGPALLLARGDHGRDVVTHCCARSVAAGVRPGMTLAHSRALLHRQPVYAEPERPEHDSAALYALARWAIRFTPAVAVDPPDGLLLDVTGCERLYGGDARLARLVFEAMARLSVGARVAVGPTVGAAWACARYAEGAITVLAGPDVRDALAPLPVAALRVDPAVVDELALVGVRRVEELVGLPRSALADRFGNAVLRRIDQALGRVPEAIDPVRPVAPPRVEREFDGPVTQYEAFELAVRGLVDALAAKLVRLQLGARQVQLRVDRADAGALAETLTLSRPCRDPKHLWALLRPRVERLNLGYGVDTVGLTAGEVGPLWPEQCGLIAVGPAQPQATAAERDRLVDLLSGRLGRDHVVACDAVDTHVPEKAFRWLPAIEASGTAPDDAAAVLTTPPVDRPSVLLDRVRPIDVTLVRPEGPVLVVHQAGGRRVLTTIGPERIDPRWWLSPPGRSPPERDYYKLQLEDGRWLWVFREHSGGRWFLHGVWG